MMTRFSMLVLLALWSLAGAQNYPGMNEADMQRMMQQAQKYSAKCTHSL